MPAHIIDGKQLATQLQQKLAVKLQQREQQGLPALGLAVILIGKDAASAVYVRHKRLACQQVGIESFAYDFPAAVSQEKILALIKELNHNPQISGILVQLPLPAHIDSNVIIDSIHPNKDVDGFHPYNLGLLAQKRPLLRPCTPYGIMTLLAHIQQPLAGLNSVVIGASNIVGRPMALELLLAGCSVTICHSKTKNLAQHVKQADLLVTAIGKPNIILTEWLQPGSIVIDVGINRNADGALIGDIDFATAKNVAGWLTPVPGGVGPMTVTTLLSNTLFAADLAIANQKELS